MSYIEQWQQLSKELGAEKFILKDNEKRPIVKAIKEICYKYNITQVIIGEMPQNRWEEITKGSFVNVLLRELDRKSTRLNSSHVSISYAVFCLKKKSKTYY